MSEELTNNGGWIASAILALIGGLKFFWDYLKKRNDNDTALKMKEADKYHISNDELRKQHTELLAKFDELEHNFIETDKKLQRALDAFEIILPLIKKMIEDKPEYKEVFDKALKHLSTNQTN